MDFQENRGIGHCGLACVLCSYEDCPGCAAKIERGDDCSAGNCVITKSLDGCYACADYDSCTEGMPHGKRSQAFIRYAREFGKQALMDRLRINFENGITYHTPDKTPGDYDILETVDEIYQLLRYGRNNPYAKCPEFETRHFHLRQVRMEDAEDLLCFYGDLRQWMFYGNSWSNGIFTSNHPTLEEMQKCIASWLGEYRNRYFIRFSVIDKATEKAIGTIEVFDNLDKAKSGAALHIDLSVPYETQSHIAELLTLADEALFPLFGFKYLIVWALPDAAERLAALRSCGYKLFESESREHYYMKESPVKIG